MNPRFVLPILAVAGACLTSLHAASLGTGFTYQGRLGDANGPVTGDYDLLFTVRDAVTNGNAVTLPLSIAPVHIASGLFTVSLDFGGIIFDGSKRWLEIGVRTNGSPGSYVTLAPAQPLTAAPYALTASTLAGTLPGGALAGNYTNRVRFTNSLNQFAGSFQGNGGSLSNLNSRTLTGPLSLDSLGHVAIGTNDTGAALQVAGGGQYLNPRLLNVITNKSPSLTNLSSPVNVFLVGSTAYVTVYSPGSLEILDVSDPLQPRLLGEAVDHALNPSSPFALAGASGLFVTNNIAYVTGETPNTLNIIDVSNPLNPVKLAILTNNVGGFTGLNIPTDVLVIGTNCFVLGFFSSSLTVIDVSVPSNPRLMTQIFDVTAVPDSPFTAMKWPYRMALSGTNLCIAARGANAVTILDVSVPANPRLLAQVIDVTVNPVSPYKGLRNANWVEVVGNTLFVAAGAFSTQFGGLTIIDITDPRRPAKLAEVLDVTIQPGSPYAKLSGGWAVRVAHNTAFVSSVLNNAVTLIDVTDPRSPQRITEWVNGVGGFDHFLSAEGMVLAGDRLYVAADGSGAINIINLVSELGLEVDQFVGIGTATPRTALDVAGVVSAQGVNVDGDLHVGGNVWAQGRYYCLFGGNYYLLNRDGAGNPVWQSSDQRLKQEIAPIEDATSLLKELRGVTYSWNEEGLRHLTRDIENQWKSATGKPEDDRRLWDEKRLEARQALSRRQIGFIAQEVERVFPDWVSVDEQGYKRINMERLNAVILDAIKEQQEQIETQKARLLALERDRDAAREKLETKTRALLHMEERLDAVEKRLNTPMPTQPGAEK